MSALTSLDFVDLFYAMHFASTNTLNKCEFNAQLKLNLALNLHLFNVYCTNKILTIKHNYLTSLDFLFYGMC